MNTTNTSISQVSRKLTLGLAIIATSLLFTSVPVIFTAGADSAAATGLVAQGSSVAANAALSQG